jgi:Protein of unknown function (DUF3752)
MPTKSSSFPTLDSGEQFVDMPARGPTLPASASGKRKRDDEISNNPDHLPTPASSHKQSLTPEASSKKPRAVGPTLPPASLDERPQTDPESAPEASSDDDDFGPALPNADPASQDSKRDVQNAAWPAEPPMPAKSGRDEWMIVPPSNSDWSSRVDPTKLRNRKFNTGKGAKGPDQVTSNGEDRKWTETPDEKKARLQREMMGITDTERSRQHHGEEAKDAAATQKLREYNVSPSAA